MEQGDSNRMSHGGRVDPTGHVQSGASLYWWDIGAEGIPENAYAVGTSSSMTVGPHNTSTAVNVPISTEHATTFVHQPCFEDLVPAQHVHREMHEAAPTYAERQMQPADRSHHPSFDITSPLNPVMIAYPPQETAIGTVHLDPTRKPVFRCHTAECAGTTFGRLQELKRHYKTFHVRSAVWCPYPGCERSEGVGGVPFPAARSDKLKDHVLRVHGMALAN